MALPKQFKQENSKNILIYHYVEELVSDFTKYSAENYLNDEISLTELPFLLRIRFKEKSTQKDLVELFHISKGYLSKILTKFEDDGLITRRENPNNRREKIVEITPKGIEKTYPLIEHITQWEHEHKTNMTNEEIKTLKELLFKFLI